ncbi:hypothetical protein HZA71_00230 [Candidatus Falkowbacteria bacterium]|nr:hypothetical protein [Candidatus Falkowbacteria bacterium]
MLKYWRQINPAPSPKSPTDKSMNFGRCWINNSRCGRAIAPSAAGIILLIIFIISFWQQYFADTLIKYAPNEAVFYVHFSLPAAKDSAGFNNLLSRLLADGGLADFKISDIKREVAVVGQVKDDKLAFSFLIRTDRPQNVKKYLKARSKTFKFLSRDIVLAPAAGNLLGDFVRNKKNKILKETKGKFSNFNSFNLYASPIFFAYFKQDLMLAIGRNLLVEPDGNFYLSAQIKRNAIKIFSPKKCQNCQGAVPDVAGDYDLIFSTGRLGQIISGWQNNLKQVSEKDDLSSAFLIPREKALDLIFPDYLKILNSQFSIMPVDKFVNSKILFLAKKKLDSHNWIFSDYDFYLSFALGGGLNKDDTDKIEQTLKSIIAQKYPKEKNVALSDGTKIIEMVPDLNRLEFIDRDGIRFVYAPDQVFYLAYKIKDSKLEITNNEEFFDPVSWHGTSFRPPAPPAPSADYLRIKTGLLPGAGFWKYIRPFNYLEAGGKEILLK